MIIKDIKIIEPDIHTDFRGDLWTLWKKEIIDLQIKKY